MERTIQHLVVDAWGFSVEMFPTNDECIFLQFISKVRVRHCFSSQKAICGLTCLPWLIRICFPCGNQVCKEVPLNHQKMLDSPLPCSVLPTISLVDVPSFFQGRTHVPSSLHRVAILITEYMNENTEDVRDMRQIWTRRLLVN